ncbi:MAG: hypothetical protein ACRDGR_06860 [bacterium]
MRWSRSAAVIVLWLAAALARAQTAGPSGGESLEEELARLKVEVLRGTPSDDPFGDGRVPDLVVLSTSDVVGEVAPCG